MRAIAEHERPAGDQRVAGRFAIPIAVAVIGCSSPHRSPMYPAGSDKDDGYGDLARSSARFLTSDRADAPLFEPHHHHPRSEGEPYGGDAYGGEVHASEPDGANPPAGTVDSAAPCSAHGRCGATPPARASHYSAVSGLTGAVEGTVSWRGALPAPIATACGPIDNPSVRVGPDRAVGGVLVYIEHVDVGRALPSYGRPAFVGGTVAKRGCVLAPALQIVTPLPASVAIHGDASPARLRITLPSGVVPYALQEAGRVVVPAELGVTRVEADDGSLGAAWIVAADTPYYAITDDRGRFRLDELAAGTYDVTFWRPPLVSVSDGKLLYGEPAIVHRSIKVEASRPARLDVSLSR